MYININLKNDVFPGITKLLEQETRFEIKTKLGKRRDL